MIRIMSKQYLIILLLAVTSVHFLFAQNTEPQQSRQKKESPIYASLYVEGGALLSMYHSTDSKLDPEFSSVFGPTGGVGVNLMFLKRDKYRSADQGRMGFQAGIHYMKSGFSADGTKVTGDYLYFPVDIQFYPVRNFYLGVGAEYCLNMKLSPSDVEIKGMRMSFEGKKSNDLKISAGVGYMLKSFPVGISIKYLMGTSEFMGNLPWKGNQIRACVFYRFGLNQ